MDRMYMQDHNNQIYDYDYIDGYDFEELADKYVKVVIKNKTNPIIYDMFINGIENVGPINLQVVEDHLNLDLEDDGDIIDEAEDTLTILDSVIESLDLKSDKPELRKLMHNLYNEALTVE